MQQSATPLFCDNCGAAIRPGSKFCGHCSAKLIQGPVPVLVPVQPTKVLQTPSILQQRYTILQQLGIGGFGAVYKARDTRFKNRTVAIKEMLSTATSPQELQEEQEQFEHEAELLSQLRHPALPQIHDYFQELGKWYIVMEFIEGETLEDFLDRQPQKQIPLPIAIHFAQAICSVLRTLHTHEDAHGQPQPIIFRDLKPANIMLTKQKQLMLIDFGIARVFKSGQAKDTVALGSPGYAAPEQYGKAQSTGAVDIYALASVLYTAYSGKDPAHIPFQYDSVYDPSEPASSVFEELLAMMHALKIEDRPSLDVIEEVLDYMTQAWPNAAPITFTKDSVTVHPPKTPVSAPPPSYPAQKQRPPTPVYVPSTTPSTPPVAKKKTPAAIPSASNYNIWAIIHPSDMAHLTEIKKHLSPLKRYQGVDYTLWENDVMQPGLGRLQELEVRAKTSRLFLVFFSPDLLSDDFWMNIVDGMIRPELMRNGKKQVLFPIRVTSTALDSNDNGIATIWNRTAVPHTWKQTLNNLKGSDREEMYANITSQIKRVLTDPDY